MRNLPSKTTVIGILLIVAVGAFLFLESIFSAGVTPGEVDFREERPEKGSTLASSMPLEHHRSKSSSWLSRTWEGITSSENNPWKRKQFNFGGHYLELTQSTDPLDQAKAEELRKRGKALYLRVLERYPELAPDFEPIPPEQNGFLKWIELQERLDADAKRLEVPEELFSHTRRSTRKKPRGAWDANATKAWLTQEQALINEIRAIGLMPDQSVASIDASRQALVDANFLFNATSALLLDARLAVESGNTPRALESIEAANGLSDHFAKIETPSFISILISNFIQEQIHQYALAELMPALPSGQLDPVTWQATIDPQVRPPSHLGRMIKGEWGFAAQNHLFPVLSDPEEPNYPIDPDLLIDLNASYTADLLSAFDLPSTTDWANLPAGGIPATSGLSRESREIFESLYLDPEMWVKRLRKSQSHFALTQAAFAIMQGQPVPLDPIYGLPYQWDPGTRELSLPDSPELGGKYLDPITVPEP